MGRMPNALRGVARRRAVLALAGVATGARRLRAETDWAPMRPVRLVVPSVAGSTPDLVCRLVAEGIRRALDAVVVIENRPGGFGTIGLSEVARAPGDGHTIGYVNVVSMAINQSLLRRQPYVIARDFAPVGMLGFVQNAILVRSGLAAETLPQLVALLRGAPGGLTYGSPGIATTGHLAMELLCSLTGTSALHVPFRGCPQMLDALRRGELDIVCDNLSSLEGVLRGGEARGLAVTGAARAPLFPDLPTVEEAGWPGFRITSWGGFVVPAGTPAAAVRRLNAAVNAALAMPDLAARLAGFAFETSPGPPEALTELTLRETPLWAELVRRSGASVD